MIRHSVTPSNSKLPNSEFLWRRRSGDSSRRRASRFAGDGKTSNLSEPIPGLREWRQTRLRLRQTRIVLPTGHTPQQRSSGGLDQIERRYRSLEDGRERRAQHAFNRPPFAIRRNSGVPYQDARGLWIKAALAAEPDTRSRGEINHDRW